ncbi:MAG: signal peptidase II, partial [Acidimicrobiales bacterium]|nr:signal peptidase II [Acidimicrobiales bacterium]
GQPEPTPERGPAGARARRMAAMAAVAALALTIDQVTKSLAEVHLANGPVHLVGSLSLTLTYNRGAAFSLAQGLTGWLVVVGVVLVIVLLLASRRLPSYSAAVAVGLMLGGAVGNLSDRLFRGNHGAVIDFVASRYWPTFNLADVAIVVGAILLIVVGYRRDPTGRRRRSSPHRDDIDEDHPWASGSDRPPGSH